MQVDGTKLKLPTYEIKSREGTYGSGVLSLDKLSTELRVGGLKFPLAPIQKLTLEVDGVLTNIDNRLLITLGGVVWTANTVIVEVPQNLTSGQTAAFTIQYGGNFYSMTNLINQKIVIPHIVDAQLVITAINFVTGAIDVETVTPVPGQAYTLTSVSESHVEGELKNVCVQEDFDYSDPAHVSLGPTGYTADTKTKTIGLKTHEFVVQESVNPSMGEPAAYDYFRDKYGNVTQIYANPIPTNIGVAQSLLTNSFKLEFSYHSLGWGSPTPQTVERPDLSVDNEVLNRIVPGVPFQVPTTQVLPANNYTLSYTGVINPNTGFRWTLDGGGLSSELTFDLVPGEWYVMQVVSGAVTGIFDYVALLSGSGPWEYRLYQEYDHQTTFEIFGPLSKICTRSETIDTRRDVHSIVLTVTPIN